MVLDATTPTKVNHKKASTLHGLVKLVGEAAPQ
jgi:hypothetical protein